MSADNSTRGHGWLLLGVAIGTWLIEIRNRSIFRELGDRGIEIERCLWGYKKADAYKAFYSRMFKTEPVDASPDTPLPPTSKSKVFIWEFPQKPEKLKKILSHTFGIDLIFAAVIVFALWQLLKP